MADNTKTTVKNVAPGIRGLNTVDGYRDLMPGETAEVTLSAAELASAKRTQYFAFGKEAQTAEAATPPGAVTPPPAATDAELPNNVPKLKKIAKDEGIDLAGATGAAGIKAAIVAGRAAKAAGGVTPTPVVGPADDLDNMNDEDLRNTVAAITGKPAPEPTGDAEADRAALLKLARGE